MELEKYKDNPRRLHTDIEVIKRKLIAPDSESDLFAEEKISAADLRAQSLTESDKMLVSMESFFEGIVLYQYPSKHEAVFGKKMIQIDGIEISKLVTSHYNEALGDIKEVVSVVDQYTQNELAQLLEKIGNKFEHLPHTGIFFSSGAHVVAARPLGGGQFEYIDINSENMRVKIGNAAETASNLFKSLSRFAPPLL